MMSRFVKQKSVRVPGIRYGRHISHVSSDRVWISDGKNHVLTNTAGDELLYLTDIASGAGVHTVNCDGELIYIDSDYNINKLSTDKVKTAFIKYNAVPWIPRCVFSSPSTGDLLVGMCHTYTPTTKVVRYNSTGKNIQTIHYDNSTGQGHYSGPNYITENRNGDVIVSESYRNAIVVTNCGGRHRFTYSGPPSGSGLLPLGICTDALSHILVCDWITQSVQIIDCDRHFLSQILTPQHGIDKPLGLSYDYTTHTLFVGSSNNTVNIYSCIYDLSLNYFSYSSLQNVKCDKHPSDTAIRYCINCGVPLCVECTIAEEHNRHIIIEIQSRKGTHETDESGIGCLAESGESFGDFSNLSEDFNEKLKSNVYQLKVVRKQIERESGVKQIKRERREMTEEK
ncbi:uncharacterized protein LOC134240243, partial [Saccostrea cucullata]|uniref:uncharacterized protein LOC134240243 n=1 Tax=Saccostrea cuccullata TaxID=36930 RepID=UPI002ED3CDEE